MRRARVVFGLLALQSVLAIYLLVFAHIGFDGFFWVAGFAIGPWVCLLAILLASFASGPRGLALSGLFLLLLSVASFAFGCFASMQPMSHYPRVEPIHLASIAGLIAAIWTLLGGGVLLGLGGAARWRSGGRTA